MIVFNTSVHQKLSQIRKRKNLNQCLIYITHQNSMLGFYVVGFGSGGGAIVMTPVKSFYKLPHLQIKPAFGQGQTDQCYYDSIFEGKILMGKMERRRGVGHERNNYVNINEEGGM